MRQLKRQDRTTWRVIDQLFDTIERSPDMGYDLRGEWAGCYAVHAGRDRYRVIWEILDAEEDYEGVTDVVVPVVILRVGPKTDSTGRTIYDEGRSQ